MVPFSSNAKFNVNLLTKVGDELSGLIAGSRIDHGHHYNSAAKALEETIALDTAVERALELVNLDDTLVIVTADHSHPLSISSYASRGNPILGKYKTYDARQRNGKSNFSVMSVCHSVQGGIHYTATGTHVGLAHPHLVNPGSVTVLNRETVSCASQLLYLEKKVYCSSTNI